MEEEILRYKLLELNIMALYDFMVPIDYNNATREYINNRKDLAVDRYRNDPIFHARIDSLVSRTLEVIRSLNNIRGLVVG